MKTKLILVIDYGTSNVRVNAIDTANGDIKYSASKKYLVQDKKCGYAEVSVDHIWTYSQDCMRQVMDKIQGEEEAKAIAFSFFGDNLIPVDKNGNALNDCILCTDPRGEKESNYINDRISETEMIDIIGDTYMLYKFGTKLLWVRNNMPEIKEATAHYDTQQQYIFRKLGITPANDYTMAARKQLCELDTLSWSKRLLEVIGVTEEELGTDIVATSAVVGYVKNYGDVEFHTSLPVIAGGHDCDMALIGMGIIDETLDYVGDITGTFDHVGYLAKGKVNLAKNNPDSPLRSYHGPFDNTSVCLGAFPTAGATLEWFMREVNEGSSQEDYQKYWKTIEFDGKGHVMMFPTMDLNRGRMEGLGVTTTKSDIFKAVIEALTFENRRLIENCENTKVGVINRVRIGGGAANSSEWMQLRADISGKKIERMKNIQSSSLGGAVMAAVTIGLYDTVEDAIDKMVQVKDVFEPNEAVRAEYEVKYQYYLRKMGYL